MKATKCDICKKYTETTIGKIEITTRGANLSDDNYSCDSCMREIKGLIKKIQTRPKESSS